jgi:hypothetical protein
MQATLNAPSSSLRDDDESSNQGVNVETRCARHPLKTTTTFTLTVITDDYDDDDVDKPPRSRAGNLNVVNCFIN